jgi:tetratricopeptide (TPR) repeat protein
MQKSIKMKRAVKHLIIFVAFAGLVALSCTSSKSLYEQGNYYEAVMRSVEKLRKNPNHKNSREALANAYPQAVNTLMDQLESNDQSNAEFKYTSAVHTYNKLNAMYESIQRSPGAQQVIHKPKKYYTTLEKIKPRAAEEQYRAGLYQLSFANRENAKQAYHYFMEADKLVPGYKNVGEKIDEAYHLSILHVVANLKPVQSRFYELSADVFYRQVNNTLKQIENNEFIRFYSPEQAVNHKIQNPDQILEISFEDFVVGETHTRETREKVERDSVIIGEITLDSGRKKEVIGSVNAELAVYRMEMSSRGIVNLTITKNGMQDKDLIYQDFPGEFVWFNEWGQFNGDDRALSDQQIAICNNKNINPPPPQQLFLEFTKPIHHQLHSKLVNFYRNY